MPLQIVTVKRLRRRETEDTTPVNAVQTQMGYQRNTGENPGKFRNYVAAVTKRVCVM